MTAGDESRLYRAILDTVEQAVAATDAHGRIVFWNRPAERLYGWPADEAMGQNLAELTVVDAPAGKRWSGHAVLKRRDSSTFMAWLKRVPIMDADGAVTGSVELSVDMDVPAGVGAAR